MRIPLLFLFVFLLSIPSFSADGWRTFSRPYPIYSVTPFVDGIVYASAGGVRIKTSTFDRVYTANNGLETSQFRAVVAGSQGIFAVSENGMVASLRADLNSWTIISRSYVANGRSVLPDQSRLVGSVLVITFEDRIAFFDVKQEKSILTLSRIGDVSFAVFPPKAISVHGNELYVSTGKKLFKRVMDWDNLWNDLHLIDPETWTQVKTDTDVYGMAWQGDSLRTFPVQGTWLWDNGESSSVQDSGAVIKLHDKEITNDDLYSKGMSVIKWIFSYDNGTDILVGPEKILRHANGNFEDLSISDAFELGAVCDLAVGPAGDVMVGTSRSAFAWSDGEKWSELRYYDERGVGNTESAYGNRMKVLSVLPDGTVIFHIWGEGFYLFDDWGKNRTKVLRPTDGLCMDNYDSNFSIAASTTPAPDGSGFLTATAYEKGYSLVFISRDGEMSCLSQVGSSIANGPIVARVAKDGTDWDVFVGTRDIPSASTTGALDVFRISPPSKNGGRMVKISRKTVNGLDKGAPIDMALDSKNDVLWMVSNSKLGYFDLDQDTIRMPTAVNGFDGAEYTSMDLDPHGNVWVGTTEKGVYRLSRKGISFDTLTSLHFTSRNGMLSNAVDDIAINPVKGVLWMAHEQGVTWYKRNDLRANESFMTDTALAEVLAYPNPFRPKIHKYISFDFLAEDATLSIYNRGGALIRFYSGSDMLGGRVDWDGTDKNGKLVVPGVYYYIVKNSKKKKKGKFIIIH